MLLQKEQKNSQLKIRAYQPGEINISGKVYRQPILISPSEINIYDDCSQFSALKIEQLLSHINDETEIIIIGSGEKHLFLASSAIKAINDKGIAIEVMGTRQACHTFQVLNFDNRKVVALLFP